MTLIPNILHQFTEFRGYKAEIVTKSNAKNSWERCLFLACIFEIYCPEVFLGCYRLPSNLRSNIASVLNCKGAAISRNVKQTKVWLEVYPDFKATVTAFSEYKKINI